MHIFNLGLINKTKHKIDFSLVPPSIILVEFAILITQFSREIFENLNKLIFLRTIHTLLMLIAAVAVWRVFKRLNKTELTYFTIAMTGVVFMFVGDLTHGVLASIFDIELVSVYRRLGIILIQGILWFPAIMIIGGNRKEIFHQFRAYEKRLITVTRAQSRTSTEFIKIQRDIQERIRKDFYAACKVLCESITSHMNKGQSLSYRYAAIAPFLAGENLRNLSRSLDVSASESPLQLKINKKKESLTLFIQQFHILYDSITRSTPLHQNSYVFMLIALATPPIINFYSLSEFVIFYPVLLILIFG
jgi:hypothetical protein